MDPSLSADEQRLLQCLLSQLEALRHQGWGRIEIVVQQHQVVTVQVTMSYK
jgi:hypothetical protein